MWPMTALIAISRRDAAGVPKKTCHLTGRVAHAHADSPIAPPGSERLRKGVSDYPRGYWRERLKT